jgi:hypothetical protein
MRQVVEIATQMLQARRTWLKVREDQLSASSSGSSASASSSGSSSGAPAPPPVVAERYSEGVMDALAWVLHVDLAHMQAPKLASVAEPPEHVLVTAVPAYNGYLVEMPANPEPGWQTEYFAYFISERQLLELARALVNLLPGTVSRSSPGASTAEADVPEPNVDAEAELTEDERAAVNDRERERERKRDPVLLFRQHTHPPRIIRQRPAAADADKGALPGWGTQAWSDGTADGGTSDAGA